MPTEAVITAKYLATPIRDKILRDRRSGVLPWRSARDTGLSLEVVLEVLANSGLNRGRLKQLAKSKGVVRT